MVQNEQRRVKVGLVGCGVVATAYYLPYLMRMETVDIVAVCYYHESSQHFIDCILEGRDPIVNVDWGLHITEMMAGAVESSNTGKRYEMTTTLDY